MPTAQEHKRACEALDTQIAAVEQAECEAEEAQLWVKEEAQVAAKQVRKQEEEQEWEREQCVGTLIKLHSS